MTLDKTMKNTVFRCRTMSTYFADVREGNLNKIKKVQTEGKNNIIKDNKKNCYVHRMEVSPNVFYCNIICFIPDNCSILKYKGMIIV